MEVIYYKIDKLRDANPVSVAIGCSPTERISSTLLILKRAIATKSLRLNVLSTRSFKQFANLIDTLMQI